MNSKYLLAYLASFQSMGVRKGVFAQQTPTKHDNFQHVI